MNLKQLSQRRGASFRLRPKPTAVSGDRVRRVAADDRWCLEDVLDAPARLVLHNLTSGQRLELQSDNVREFRSPDFLLLRCQLLLRGDVIDIEPVAAGAAYPSDVLPLDDLLKELRGAPLMNREGLEDRFRGVAVTYSGRLGS